MIQQLTGGNLCLHFPQGQGELYNLADIVILVFILTQVMRVVDNIRPDRQTVLFSATFPRQMEALARKILTKPIEVTVGGRSVVCSDVEQHVVSIVSLYTCAI